MNNWHIRILDTPEELQMVEELQRIIWPGSETDVVPLHLLRTAVHNGGLVIGAAIPGSESDQMVGFVFGFPGFYTTPDGPRLKHCSHMLGVHPEFRGQGLGFQLKRAQWQIVRHQGLDRITWTYDPLLSRNAHLNVARLGAVCSRYLRAVYGEMRDELNKGLPSDRFEVDWWVNTQRVDRRLSKNARLRLDLSQFLAAGAEVINPARINEQGWPAPAELVKFPEALEHGEEVPVLLLVEVPADFQELKRNDVELARGWRMHSRMVFEKLFEDGYLVTDFVYMPGKEPRSYYVMTHGEATL